MAKVRARLLSKLCDKTDLALCDRDELRLSTLAKETGIANVFSDLEILLTQFKPDIVHVLTPPLTHKAVALQCLAKGAHVLVEKPLCVSSQEAQEIQNFADSQGRKVCVSH
ncbi:MAG: Gfo/Idh/MocA family oxidoreductase, partial [Acidobacteriota bacterium]